MFFLNGFEQDIQAQASVLRMVSDTYWRQLPREHDLLRAWASECPAIVLTGMGGSLAAAELVVSRLRRVGLVAVAVDASELLPELPQAFVQDSLVLAISQTGRSHETVLAAEAARRAGVERIVALVNDMDSPLARLASIALPMLAGKERWAAAKSFTASQLILLKFSNVMLGNREGDAVAAALPDVVEHVSWQEADGVALAADFLSDVPYLAILGRGSAMSTARYASLLLKESVALPCEAMTVADFGHGPIELTTLSIGVVILSPERTYHEDDIKTAKFLAGLGAKTWLLGLDVDGPPAVNARLLMTPLPELTPPAGAIAATVVLQRFAAALARSRGREPGVFTAFNRSQTTG